MRCKSILLGGAALATALALAIPATAQSSQNTGGYGSMQNLQQQTPMQSTQPMGTQPTTSNTMGSQAAGIQPLSQVSDPSTTLASATVQDSSGQSVGQVQSVKTTTAGKASSVAVTLTSSNKTVSIRASRLRYDPSSKTLKASLTSSQISSLPATQSP